MRLKWFPARPRARSRKESSHLFLGYFQRHHRVLHRRFRLQRQHVIGVRLRFQRVLRRLHREIKLFFRHVVPIFGHVHGVCQDFERVFVLVVIRRRRELLQRRCRRRLGRRRRRRLIFVVFFHETQRSLVFALPPSLHRLAVVRCHFLMWYMCAYVVWGNLFVLRKNWKKNWSSLISARARIDREIKRDGFLFPRRRNEKRN